MTPIESFKQIYKANREEKEKTYSKESEIEIDFNKKNGKYTGEDLIKLRKYIYTLKISGHHFKDIAAFVDLCIGTVYYHFTKYQPEYKK